jgi:MFS family permease
VTAPAVIGPGARAWGAWALPAFLFLIAFLHRPAPGIVARELMDAFGISGALVGLLSATYFYAYAGLIVPAGLLLDRFGVRRVVAAGGAVMGLGTVLMSVAPTAAPLFAGRFLIGLGGSVTFVGALKVAATWFPPSRFGTLAALTATVGSFGGLLGTAPLAALVAGAGWRGAFGLIGLVTLAGAAACLGWVRDHPPMAPPPAAVPRFGAVARGTRDVLANPGTWPPFLAFFCLVAAASNLSLWVVPYLRDVYRLDTPEAALYATGSALAVMVAGPFTGFASDQLVRRRKLPYTVLTLALLVLWLVLVGTLGRLPLAGLYLLFVGMGAVGSAYVLTWPIGREVNPPHLAGIAVAVVNLGGLLGAAVTQGAIGAVLDARWTGVAAGEVRIYPLAAYRAAFAVCAGFIVAAAATTFFLRETRGENVYTGRS